MLRWEEAAKRHDGVDILPLVFYLDGTWVSKTGSSSIKPIAMSIGNFELELLNQDMAKRLVGFMPALTGPKSLRNTDAFRTSAAYLYRQSFESILSSVKRTQASGGCFFRIHGEDEPRFMMPLVAFIVQDMPEGHLLTTTLDSGQTSRPCMSCLVPVDDIQDPHKSCDAAGKCRRTTEHMKTEVGKYNNQLKNAEPSGANCKSNIIKRATSELSAHLIGNAFWDIDFGADYGIYGAVAPDRLHEWWEGIVKYIIDHVVKLCVEEHEMSKQEKKRDAQTKKAGSSQKRKREQKYLESHSALDARIQAIDPRTGDVCSYMLVVCPYFITNTGILITYGRICSLNGTFTGDASIPKSRFRTGFTKLPSIPAFEIQALLVQLPAALGVTERFLKLGTCTSPMRSTRSCLHLRARFYNSAPVFASPRPY